MVASWTALLSSHFATCCQFQEIIYFIVNSHCKFLLLLIITTILYSFLMLLQQQCVLTSGVALYK